MIKTYTGDQRVVTRILEDKARTIGDKEYLRYKETSVTFARMDEIANRVGNSLFDIGIAKGDNLLIMLPNGLEIIYSWFGAAKIGAVEVPVNFNLKGNTLLHIINDSRADTMIIDSEYLDRLELIQKDAGYLKRVIVSGKTEGPVLEGTKFQVLDFADLLNGSPDAPAVEVLARDPATIMYTSGTTGPPKGVIQPHGYAYCYCCPVCTAVPLADGTMSDVFVKEGDVFYSYLPMYHTAAKYMEVAAAMISNSTLVIAEGFHPATYWSEASKHGATFCYALFAAAFLQGMPPTETDAGNTVERMLCIPLIPQINDFSQRFGVDVYTGYGLSEGGTVLSSKVPENLSDTSLLGKPRSDFDITLLGDDGYPVEPGSVGELCMRPKIPYTTMLGYYNQTQKTIEAWEDLWLHTGDLARQSDDGYFYYAGRLKERIRRRGENISPDSIEMEINSHPDVTECAAVPVDSDFGMANENEILVTVILKEGKSLAPEELIRFLEPRLPRFMIPRYIKFVEDLPRTATFKVKRVLLQDGWSDGEVWDLNKSGIKLKK